MLSPPVVHHARTRQPAKLAAGVVANFVDGWWWADSIAAFVVAAFGGSQGRRGMARLYLRDFNRECSSRTSMITAIAIGASAYLHHERGHHPIVNPPKDFFTP
jgi:hypothetical protein